MPFGLQSRRWSCGTWSRWEAVQQERACNSERCNPREPCQVLLIALPATMLWQQQQRRTSTAAAAQPAQVWSPLEAIERIWCEGRWWGPQLGIVAQREPSLKHLLAPAPASAWLIAGFDVHVSASGSAAMDATDDAVDPGLRDRLAELESWTTRQTDLLSNDLYHCAAAVCHNSTDVAREDGTFRWAMSPRTDSWPGGPMGSGGCGKQ